MKALLASILTLMKTAPSPQSLDYVETKKEFQLHTLVTEQRHPKTLNLSYTIQKDTESGIEQLLSVDEDISNKFLEMSKDVSILDQAALAVEKALLEKRKIYIYGCGATGRLAKQMESSFWRPFWKKLSSNPQFSGYESLLIGEMTGADRALISSLEGFEDLQLIGQLQLDDHGIQKEDLVFAITEGGETSSVIGTILHAAKLNAKEENPSERLYFIYNNPDCVLLPFTRSRSVLENDSITKLCLCTGPQSITGSTRLQATTSETFVMGIILEQGIQRFLSRFLSADEMKALGFDASMTMEKRLLSFIPIQKAIYERKKEIAKLTDLEAETYASGHFSTYFAKDAMVTVFIDSTERAPTFRLFPLDTILLQERKSWIQIWTPSSDLSQAWIDFLGRPFRGLDPAFYESPFSSEIADPYLKKAALTSLKNAGNDQQFLYDFSFSESNLLRRGPKPGDLGVMVALSGEDTGLFQSWLSEFSQAQANLAIVTNGSLSCSPMNAVVIPLQVQPESDPLSLRQHIGIKMMLNAHSTGVMAKLGRVVGNTMSHVNPGNLKLIGRATYLIQSHVNDHLNEAISYSEANAVLFDAIDYVKQHQKMGKVSEVGLSIIRILESARQNTDVSWEEAEALLLNNGLEKYLLSKKKLG